MLFGALFALCLCGCNWIEAAVVLGAPSHVTVPAEYDRLPGHRVVVHVWTPVEYAWDYPKLRLDLAARLSDLLAEKVKDITVIEALRVEDYLERFGTADVDPVELGRHFEADMVVHMSIYQFSMRDPGMANFYRGRIGASVTVYDLTGEDRGAETTPLGQIQVAVPEEGKYSYGSMRPDQVRAATYQAFTVEVGKKFHEYEQPIG
jgi:hypothetical protein